MKFTSWEFKVQKMGADEMPKKRKRREGENEPDVAITTINETEQRTINNINETAQRIDNDIQHQQNAIGEIIEGIIELISEQEEIRNEQQEIRDEQQEIRDELQEIREMFARMNEQVTSLTIILPQRGTLS